MTNLFFFAKQNGHLVLITTEPSWSVINREYDMFSVQLLCIYGHDSYGVMILSLSLSLPTHKIMEYFIFGQEKC